MSRYDRNVAALGLEAQARLQAASVLVVGAGGLGSPVALYLAAAGVGRLGIVDFDTVALSNLNRQILHRTEDVGELKTTSAARAVHALNPGTAVILHNRKFVPALIENYDLVVECCDNFEAKFAVNDACVAASKPYVHGAVLGLGGEVLTYAPGHADLRVFFPEPPAEGTYRTAAQAGAVGAAAGVIGSLQALEAIKLLTQTGDPLLDRLLVFDGSTGKIRELRL